MKEIPVWEKLLLSIEEAAVYTGIGVNRIRNILYTPGCPFAIYVSQGSALIKRKEFEEYISQTERLV